MYYFKMVVDKKITSVEAKTVDVASPGFVKATKEKYDAFIATLPAPASIPPRDLGTEIDEVKAMLVKLEGTTLNRYLLS